MKTIEIQAFEFNELNEKAKENALNNFIEYDDNCWIYDDANNTIKEFNELFNIKSGRDYYQYTINQVTNIMNLKGLRLRKYLINNFGYILFKPKYIKSLKENTKAIKHKRIKVKTYKNGSISNVYYSAINTEIGYNLTGVCYDYDILEPIYDFIEYKDAKNYNNTDFEDIISECFANLEKSINNEIEYLQSMEYFAEHCENNNLIFDENGKEL